MAVPFTSAHVEMFQSQQLRRTRLLPRKSWEMNQEQPETNQHLGSLLMLRSAYAEAGSRCQMGFLEEQTGVQKQATN